MIAHQEITTSALYVLLKHDALRFEGNKKLKIYGKLHCQSGKKMKRGNRVFFVDKNEAIRNGYRPCGSCMKEAYLMWKDGIVQREYSAQ